MCLQLKDKNIILYIPNEGLIWREDILFTNEEDFELSFTKFKILYDLYESEDNKIKYDKELTDNTLYVQAIKSLIDEEYIEEVLS